jgi:hypothetical protein
MPLFPFRNPLPYRISAQNPLFPGKAIHIQAEKASD